MTASVITQTLSSSLPAAGGPTFSSREESVSRAAWEKLSRVSDEPEDVVLEATTGYEEGETPLAYLTEMGARGDRIAAIMLRPETLRLLDLLNGEESPEAIYHFLVESARSLHAFADLVGEDLITVMQGRLVVTTLAGRVVARLAEMG